MTIVNGGIIVLYPPLSLLLAFDPLAIVNILLTGLNSNTMVKPFMKIPFIKVARSFSVVPLPMRFAILKLSLILIALAFYLSFNKNSRLPYPIRCNVVLNQSAFPMGHSIDKLTLVLAVVASNKQALTRTFELLVKFANIDTFKFLNDEYSSPKLIIPRHHSSVINVVLLSPRLRRNRFAQ